MGCIIRMDSEKFVMKFLKEYDANDFQFILVSDNITTTKKYKNIMAIPALIPPPNVISEYINEGFSKDYKKKYLDYLKKDDVNALVSILVKAAMGDMRLVLLCSKSEDEYKYLKMLCEFIENYYKLKSYKLKDFKKDPEKACKIKNKDEVVKILSKTMEKLKDVGENLSPEIDKDKFIKKLKKLEKKELYTFCKNKGIKVDKDMGKDDLIKKIKKKLFK